MSFSSKFRTLGSGNSYGSRRQLEISAHDEEATGEVETATSEVNEENSIRFSPDSVDEGIKTSLEPLHSQVSALTETMDRLIQRNSANDTTTASSPETRNQ